MFWNLFLSHIAWCTSYTSHIAWDKKASFLHCTKCTVCVCMSLCEYVKTMTICTCLCVRAPPREWARGRIYVCVRMRIYVCVGACIIRVHICVCVSAWLHYKPAYLCMCVSACYIYVCIYVWVLPNSLLIYVWDNEPTYTHSHLPTLITLMHPVDSNDRKFTHSIYTHIYPL